MPVQNHPISRRAITRGAAWSAPAVAIALAAPAIAASPASSSGEYGLFVSAQNNGGYAGYAGSNAPVQTAATTPAAYFANPPTSTQAHVQGTGSFTPVTNGPSGSDGSYSSTSGFWWSVPTTKTRPGTGYVAGSTATLKAGAVFTTTVTYAFLPDQTDAPTTCRSTCRRTSGTRPISRPELSSTSRRPRRTCPSERSPGAGRPPSRRSRAPRMGRPPSQAP